MAAPRSSANAAVDPAEHSSYRPTVELIAALAAAAWWCLQAEAAFPPPGWLRALPLALLALLVADAVGRDGRWPRVMGAAAAVLLVSAVPLLRAGGDTATAISKFWMMAGALGVAAALAVQPSTTHVRFAAALLAASGTALSLVFVATNDWFADPVKFPLIATAGDAIARRFPWRPASPTVHPNVAGGILAMLIPLVVPLGMAARTGAARAAAGAAGALLVLVLWLTASRAAWLASLVTGAVWWVASARGGVRRWPRAVLIAGGVLAFLLYVTMSAGPGLSNRAAIQSRALVLAQDYLLTGAGLASFPLQFGLYAEVGSVQSAVHAHNLFLDVLIEQGLAGLVAAVGLMALTIHCGLRARRDVRVSVRLMAEAALASQAIVLLHGLMDDTLYSSRGIVLLFVPAGLAAALDGLARPYAHLKPAGRISSWVPAALIAGLSVAVARPAMSTWHANLGALYQSAAELSAYDPSRLNERSIHEVRRLVHLDSALNRFRRAEEMTPHQPTASRRLVMIWLARGEYSQALSTIEALWNAGYRDHATRLLLGDALVANGRVDAAVELLERDPEAAERLKSQAWYRYWINDDYARAADAWTTAARLDPADADAREWAKTALARRDQAKGHHP